MEAPPRSIILDAKEYWSTDPNVPYLIRMQTDGPGAEPPKSIMELLHSNAVNFPDHPALVYDTLVQSGNAISYSQYEQKVLQIAKALIKIGLERRHSVAILSDNCLQWFYAALATIYANGIVVGIYPTCSAEGIHHILENSRANIVIVDRVYQLQKVLAIRDKLPQLKAIVQIDIPYHHNLTQNDGYFIWSDLERMTVTDLDQELIKRQETNGVNQAAALIYTSGTTGPPKGVLLSQDNLLWNAKRHMTGQGAEEMGKEVFLSYLPLNHIAGQMEIYTSLLVAGTVHIAPRNALNGPSIISSLVTTRPTRLLTVPRICEKIQERIDSALKTSNNNVLNWAKGVATTYHMNNSSGGAKRKWQYGVAQSLILTKLKSTIGLDRCESVICGAAPVSAELKRYFLGMDLPVLDGYGLSECSATHCLSKLDGFTMNSVGRTLPGSETKIEKPDANGVGEICIKGRNVFMGYIWDEEATRKTLDEKGWLHTGDLGRFDKEGYLCLSGRLKELIITSGGENIAPVPIEHMIKKELPCVSYAVVIGDYRKFLSVLITLKTQVDETTHEPNDQLQESTIAWLKTLGLNYKTISEVINFKSGICPVVQKAIKEGIERANEFSTSRAHKVQKFILVDHDFSIATGELGPSLKLKRSVIADMYKEKIDKLYE